MTLRSLTLSSSVFSSMRASPAEDGAGDPPETPPAADPPAADPPPADPPAADPPAAAASEGGEPPDPERETRWRDREISRKHAQLKERERQMEDLRRENESLRAIAERRPAADPPADGETPPAARPATPDTAAVRAEAERIVAQDNYTRDCNAADAAARKEFGADKWSEAVNRLTQLGGVKVEDMVQVLATDNPARVLYELGTNPEAYQKIMDMSPARRMNEFAKIATAVAPKKKVSEAPAPVDPVRGGGGGRTGDGLDDELEDDQWYKNRAAQKREKFKQQLAAEGRSR